MALTGTDYLSACNDALPIAAGEYHCRVPAMQTTFFQCKRHVERFIAAVLLALSSPLIAILVLAVKLSSRGPAIYSQIRVGLAGRTFVMYKLRTMRDDAETVSGPRWARAGNDSRITPLGIWLRRLHLDELPQLYNVVRGDMSLVGPRPERPEFVAVLAPQIAGYLDRLQVLPGITGLAQVNLPPDTDLNSVRRKLVLDLEYIESAAVGLELRIIACTLLRLVGLRHGKAVSLLGLTRTVDVVAPTGPITALTPTALARENRAAAPEREDQPAGHDSSEEIALQTKVGQMDSTDADLVSLGG
jgi:lipopolysaccharide/colanic/teichoic acid biosynthesis glycosyltransferase